MIMREVIKLQAHYLESRILSIHMDNDAELSSWASITCMALRIEVQHSIPYVHTQNGLARSIIQRIKLIARPFLLNCNYQLDVGVIQLYTLFND
jgi:hypothetical protein